MIQIPLAFRRASVLVPIGALLFSALLLIPGRYLIALNITYSYRSYRHMPPPTPIIFETNGIAEIQLPQSLNSFDQAERSLNRVALLNLPAMLISAPEAIFSSGHMSWHPDGMTFKVWNALSYPFLALVFWWIIGRGIDALLAIRHGSLDPPLRWFDVLVTAILLSGGIALAIGYFVSATPEDKADGVLAGICSAAACWAAMAILPTLAWIFQFRYKRKMRTAKS
jgi:hypothetical protein